MKLIAEITDKEILGTDGLSYAKPRYTARAIVKNGDLYAVICSEKSHPFSLPGGGIDNGEDIVTALKREMLEETGCTCKKISELGMVKENRARADYTQCSYYYVVEADIMGAPKYTEEETKSGTTLQWHTLPEMIKLINELEPMTYQQQYLKARDVAALNEYIGMVTKMEKNCKWCNLSEAEKKYLLIQGNHWDVYLADKQDYIGRCILVLNRHCAALSKLDSNEWAELKALIEQLETAIANALGASMFNWSCLMNDFYKSESPNPHLHIHIRPRYNSPITINGKAFIDEEFAHHYDNHKQNKLTETETEMVYKLIKEAINGLL